jgi:ribonuclease P protein component
LNIPGGTALRIDRYLTGKAQFELVYEKGRSWAAREIVMRAMPNGLDSSRYGLTVSKRVGKAVTRNLVKRRLREILRHTVIKPGWDIVFVARPPAAGVDYSSLRDTVRILLNRAGIFVGEHEGVSPGAH